MKKNTILSIAALLLVAMFALTACGSGSTPASVADSTPAADSAPAVAGDSSVADAADEATGIFEAEGRQYITAEQLKADIEGGNAPFLLDIQPEENFEANHLEGAYPTYAFPVETEEEQAAIDEALTQAGSQDVVIVCPGGKGGANNTWDYLVSIDHDMSNIYILENGQNGWEYEDLLA